MRERSGATPQPGVSVVIPCLDESQCLGDLLRDLAAQRGIDLEVVVVDGGSRDGTAELAEAVSRDVSFPLRVLRAGRGRARQLNAGARVASAPEILFLHADCRLDDSGLLARAQRDLACERGRRGSDRVAGHFGVRFLRAEARPSLAYYFYEAKASLNRPDCVNGDQGFWLSRRYFDELGGFDESAALLEDAALAALVFATGAWIRLPGTVLTSARRFEAEGLLERQTVNALLRAFDALALPSFFRHAAELYRVHSAAQRLVLPLFFQAAHGSLWDDGVREGLRRWLRAGRYVRSQAWQLAFWLDCRRNFRRSLPPGHGPLPWLQAWERWTGGGRPCRVADAVAAVGTAGWLYGGMVWTGAHGGFSRPRRRISR